MIDNIMKELQIDNIDEIQTIPATSEEETGMQMEDFFASSLADLDAFDNNAWSKGDGLKMPKFPIITEKLEGLDSGLYLFAGKSNHGKSAMMMNLMYDACSNPENKLFGLYFSLDDSKNEIIPRMIAMDQSIPIGVAAKPQRYQNMIDNMEEGSSIYVNLLEKRALGLERLRDTVSKFKVEDSTKLKNIDDMHDYIKLVLTYLRAIDPEYKILIAIDSINDVRLTKKPDDNDTLAEIARQVKHWSVEFDCPIFASTHIRKLNGARRPSIEDLKDSSVLVYEASVVWIVFNDISENKDGANIYQTDINDNSKQPILEIDWAKNKKSSYKGRSFCFFRPEYSKAMECDTESNRRYNALLLEKAS